MLKRPPVILITCTRQQIQFCFVDWAESPWAEEYYLGRQLDKEAARNSPLRPTFLEVAEHIVNDLPEVGEYFATRA